jgi:ribosome-associated toxin RatA of RatAB toxin-antitoxin module
MVRPYAKRNVNYSYSTVWKLLSDVESPKQYHPYIQDLEIGSTQRKGLGCRRIIHYVDGTKDIEEIVQVGKGYITFKHSSLDGKPGTNYTMTFTIKELHPTWTQVTLQAKYDLPTGLSGIIQYLVPTPSERRLQRTFYHILDGIEYHLSTNRQVQRSLHPQPDEGATAAHWTSNATLSPVMP